MYTLEKLVVNHVSAQKTSNQPISIGLFLYCGYRKNFLAHLDLFCYGTQVTIAKIWL